MSDQGKQTLKAAFAAIGEPNATDGLPKKAQDMTKAQVEALLAFDEHTLAAIKVFATKRIADGKKLLPWEDLSGGDDAGDDMKGGWW